MIDEALKKEILESIELTGRAIDSEIKINVNINDVLSFSSGAARLQKTLLRKASLIISQPQALVRLNPFQIRCMLYKAVISYPAWYYEIKYAVNHLHYFICFDIDNPLKPTTKCYRRTV